MAVSWQQVAIVLPAAAGLVAVLTQWVALRGGSMKRLAIAAEASAAIQAAPEPERWLLEARFYNALRRDYYPARGWLALTLFLAWYTGIVGLVMLASWAEAGVAGSVIIFAVMAAYSMAILRSLKRNFGREARHLNAHNEISELELAAIDKFLVERGRSPTPRDDFEKRIQQRELVERLTAPVRFWWAKVLLRHPRIVERIALAAMIGLVAFLIAGLIWL